MGKTIAEKIFDSHRVDNPFGDIHVIRRRARQIGLQQGLVEPPGTVAARHDGQIRHRHIGPLQTPGTGQPDGIGQPDRHENLKWLSPKNLASSSTPPSSLTF